MQRWRQHLRFLTAVQLLPALESGEEILVGGQAVMEGVMMRSPHAWGIAVRKSSGEIVTHSEPLERASEHLRIIDTFAGSGRHTLAWHFHCAPGVTTVVGRAGVEIAAGSVRARLRVPDNVHARLEDAWYSPSYGVMIPTGAIAIEADISLQGSAAFAFEFVPE